MEKLIDVNLEIKNINKILRDHGYEDHHRLRHHREIFNDLYKVTKDYINKELMIPLYVTIDYEKENDHDYLLFTLHSASLIDNIWLLSYVHTYDNDKN